MKSVNALMVWIVAILIIVLATVFYQPAAAKTGSLLIWMKNRIYVMDIDTLILQRVGVAGPDEVIAPSPGCFGQIDLPCWVTAGQRLYQINPDINDDEPENLLPLGDGFEWTDSTISWSPDGQHLAYTLLEPAGKQFELRVYNAATGQIELTQSNIDPTIAVAWTQACRQGLTVSNCKLAYKRQGEAPLQLVALTPATKEQKLWDIPLEQIFELRWTSDDQLLFSQPKRHFHRAADFEPVYPIPPGGQLANLSPYGNYTIYYQPFTLQDCKATTQQACLYLGVWLGERGSEEKNPKLIYNVNLGESQTGGLNFIPSWSSGENAAVFFQDGKLINYDLQEQEATVWYKSVRGKLRSVPVFSPSGEAVAFVDNQGQGFSEYRLVVVNPKLQPIEHIIETDSGFRILAWLP